MDARTPLRAARSTVRSLARRGRTEAAWLATRRGAADLAIFHEYAPPPSGGGHQFLRALESELGSRGFVIEHNTISAGTGACLFNSFNFDFERLRRFTRGGCRMVHRVDGPVGVYRGFDDGTDWRIADVNAALADVTVFQSRYSLEKHQELGLELRAPAVVSNSVDPSIFHPPAARPSLEGRKVRVIATSWSSNPRKGADTFVWLDRHLDFDRYEVTFVGQIEQAFAHVRVLGPVASLEVADLLRSHDVYVAASRDDPCSNALLEALACGLPAAYLKSGGHPELVGAGGLAFGTEDELPTTLDRLAADLDAYRSRIAVPAISDVASRYLELLGLPRTRRP